MPWPGTVKSISTRTCGAADAHGCDRRIDHVAVRCAVSPATNVMVPATRLSSGELFDPFGSADHLVEHHARI